MSARQMSIKYTIRLKKIKIPVHFAKFARTLPAVNYYHKALPLGGYSSPRFASESIIYHANFKAFTHDRYEQLM